MSSIAALSPWRHRRRSEVTASRGKSLTTLKFCHPDVADHLRHVEHHAIARGRQAAVHRANVSDRQTRAVRVMDRDRRFKGAHGPALEALRPHAPRTVPIRLVI